jgi:YVTN family beta-propeller protein
VVKAAGFSSFSSEAAPSVGRLDAEQNHCRFGKLRSGWSVNKFSILAAFVAVLTAGGAQAQWLETTIYLDDSLSVMHVPTALAYDSVGNTVYIGGEGGCVLAFNGTTNSEVGRATTGSGIRALCCNPLDGKVYSANLNDDNLTVIDEVTHQAIATVATGQNPFALCYDQQNDKIYCANQNGALRGFVWVV